MGEINWKEVALKDVLASKDGYIRGPFGSALKRGELLSERGIPVYEQKNAIEGHREFRYFVNQEKYQELSRFTVKENDLIISCSGTIGEVSIIQEGDPKGIISQALLILRANSNVILPQYLKYFLLSPMGRHSITSVSSGSVQVNIAGRKVIENIKLNLPSISEQGRIIGILGTLDDMIELNNRMNVTLEAIARAIFKSWFVDFTPVRAILDGSPTDLPEEIKNLLPDGFEDSELGKIPKGWEISPIGDHITPTKGLSYKGKHLSDNGMPLHNLNSVYEGGGYKYEGIKYYTGEFKERHKILAGDIVIANTEQGFDHLLIGYPAIVPRCYEGSGIFSHHLYKIDFKPETPLRKRFLYFMMMSYAFRGRFIGYTNGSTVNMLPPDALEKPAVLIPPRELIDKFENSVMSIFKKIEASEIENDLLGNLRDTMLPRLMRGDLEFGKEN